MIGNLNQLSFQRYGSIRSERTHASEHPGRDARKRVLELDCDRIPIYVSQGESWLRSHVGMTVLSVSEDGKSYQHFYLDKTVSIRPGIRFVLSVFNGTHSSVELWGEELSVVGMTQEGHELKLQRHLQVSAIYTFFYHEKEKGFIFPGESHQPLELTYVDKGSIHSVADGRDIVLSQGDLIIYGPNQWHMQYSDVDVSASYITITFDLVGDYPDTMFNQKYTISQSAVPMLQWMLREQDRMDTYSADMLISLLQTMLVMMLREQTVPTTTKLRTANSVNSENEIIRRAQQYISAHVREKLTVPLVARHVDVSPSYLTALFRKNLQISPGEYVRRIKLQESKQMIREDNMNFTEIAAALQYSTVHHFSRQFKDKFGITPTEYAKSVR